MFTASCSRRRSCVPGVGVGQREGLDGGYIVLLLHSQGKGIERNGGERRSHSEQHQGGLIRKDCARVYSAHACAHAVDGVRERKERGYVGGEPFAEH